MRVTAKRWNKKTVEKRLNMHGFILQMYAEPALLKTRSS
jgi:hypothetical protein